MKGNGNCHSRSNKNSHYPHPEAQWLLPSNNKKT
jgi:hypothetical protein